MPVVLVETKADLVEDGWMPAATLGREMAGKLRVSAVSGRGLDQMRHLLPELAYASVVTMGDEAPVVTRRRHREGLERALEELRAFRNGLEEGLPPEVAATHLRPAESALEEILGVISTDDVLDVVFAEFCVGK